MSAKDIRKASEDYFVTASELRVNIERNLEDHEFAHRQHGKIVYLFDTNIVYLYLRPIQERFHLTAFGGENASHMSGTAVCTAEFLYSRQLPGQWGSPPMISSAHGKELIQFSEKTYKELKAVIEGNFEAFSADRDALGNDLLPFVQELRNAAKISTAQIDNLNTRVAKLANALANIPLIEAELLVRLFNEDLMRPMALDRLATEDVLNPPAAEVNAWYTRIINKRKERGGSLASGFSENARRDAETIVQVLKLNENAKDEVHPVRYVFVSTDWSVYVAFNEWFIENVENRQEFFPLRRPTQYLPILNVEDMPNRIDQNETIRFLKNTLDSLLYNLKDTDPDYPHSLPGYYDSLLRELAQQPEGEESGDVGNEWAARFARDLFSMENGHRDYEKLRREWTATGKKVLSLNVPLLQRRFEQFTPLAELMTSKHGLLEKLQDYIYKTLVRLESAHTAASLRFYLIDQYLGPDRSEKATSGSGLMIIDEPFKDYTDGLPLSEYLNNFAHTAGKESIERVTKLIREHGQGDYRAMFFVAAVAFRCGMWEAAHHCANRADQMIRNKSLDANLAAQHHEILSFATVALRYTMTETRPHRLESQYEKARAMVVENATYYRNEEHAMLLCRALGEFANLNTLTALILSLEETPRDLIWVDPDEIADEAYNSFREAREIIQTQPSDHNLFHLLIVQLTGVLAGLAIFNSLFRDADAALEVDDIRWAESELTTSFEKARHEVPAIYGVAIPILRAMLPENARNRRTLFDESGHFIQSIIEDKNTRPLPWYEKLLPNIAKRLKAKSG